MRTRDDQSLRARLLLALGAMTVASLHGGSPAEACHAFGLKGEPAADWSIAVDRIALALCAPPLRKAA